MNRLILKSKLDQKIIMPTTNSAYGSGDDKNYCDEKSPLNPISKYAKDKGNCRKETYEVDNYISPDWQQFLACLQDS